jgi:hypothetical protein
MVRGNGSARAETSVKAAARPNTIRIKMRRGPLRDTLDDDPSTITISPSLAQASTNCKPVINLDVDAPNPLAVLRTRCDRPSRSRAAQQRDEFASFRRITSREARRS